MNKIKKTEVIDSNIDLDINNDEVKKYSTDIFHRWKTEEYVEENHTSEGIYLCDGIYVE